MASFAMAPVAKVVKAKESKEELVPMEFPGPADVRLALQNGTIMIFKPGVQMVPVSLKNHTWLKCHKVKEVKMPAKLPADEVQETLDAQAKAKEEQEKAEAEQRKSKLQTVLAAMTKADLVVYGKTKYDLALDGAAKKDELIAAILEAAALKGE